MLVRAATRAYKSAVEPASPVCSPASVIFASVPSAPPKSPFGALGSHVPASWNAPRSQSAAKFFEAEFGGSAALTMQPSVLQRVCEYTSIERQMGAVMMGRQTYSEHSSKKQGHPSLPGQLPDPLTVLVPVVDKQIE
jgi:hypothetical protein